MIKNLIYLAIFTTFIVAVWTGLSIYHNYSKTTISQIQQIQIVPIEESFNFEVISSLKQRKQVSINLSDTLIASTDEEEAPEQTSDDTIPTQGQPLNIQPSILPTVIPEGASDL